MLDKRTNLLLKFIVLQCDEGAYQVLNISDMISAMPKKYKINIDNITHMITYLAERSYIDVKHCDENVVCLAPLPKARLKAEQDLIQKKGSSHSRKITLVILFLIFLTSFVGAFLGSYLSRILLRG